MSMTYRSARAGLGLLVAAAMVAFAIAFTMAGPAADKAIASHCVHHHPDHHRTGSSGFTEHHFHQSHDWGDNSGSIWLVASGEHFCFSD